MHTGSLTPIHLLPPFLRAAVDALLLPENLQRRSSPHNPQSVIQIFWKIQVSVYDLDWSHPTAIVVGNEHMGTSHEALLHANLHCSIPMKGMVDSFNVSVAAGILMHHAVCDRISRLGHHGDLTSEERQILLAEFVLRHRESTMSIVHEHVKRKLGNGFAEASI